MTDKTICQLILSTLNKTDNVLDIGCGDGYLCNCLAQKLQKPVIGLDISSKGFAKAHKTCEEFKTCHLIKCLDGKVEDLKNIVNSEKYDAITFVHSFHHIGNIKQAVDQSRQTLQKGGRLIIAEYSPERGKKEDKCKRFTIKFIVDLLIKNDFKTILLQQPEKGFFLLNARI